MPEAKGSRTVASDSREFWEQHCTFGASALWRMYPPQDGGLSRPGWQHAREKAQGRWSELDWGVTIRGKAPVHESDTFLPTPTPAEQVERDSEHERMRKELADIKAKYRHALRDKHVHEDILDAARATLEAAGPITPLPAHIGTGTTNEDAILGWADWHWGEVVDYDVMQGYNAYDPDIARQRAQRTADKTLSLLFENHSGTTFHRLYVFDLGDTVAGDLLEDNKSTNAQSVFEAFVDAANVKAKLLLELAHHIPVTYVAIPGNHGRRTAKMPWKQPQETADWLIAQMVAIRCERNELVECVIPNAWTAHVEIRGRTHALNHGYSAARGGYGGIPFYAFQRADGKKTAMEAAHGRFVDYRWYGHIHTPADLPKMDGRGEQFIVGSLKGGDEYALEELNAYSEPCQKLVGVHEKYGVTWRYRLDVKGDE